MDFFLLDNLISSLQDCHTVGHYAPVVDTKQDWHLLKGMENDFGTVLTFTRKLDTCDDEDMVITVGTGYCAIVGKKVHFHAKFDENNINFLHNLFKI